MSAPLTIEQMIQNHNINVNIADAKTLDGHKLEEFAMIGHKHDAKDITSGIVSPERLPSATANSAGVVQLSSSTASDSESVAASSKAVKAVKLAADGKAAKDHKHAPKDITTGTFEALIVAQSNTNYSSRQIRNTIFSTAAPTDTAGQNGDVWMRYK